MGIAFSHPPPPLVEVNTPHNRVLVPAGTSFTVNGPRNPKHFPYLSRGRRPQKTPIYQRVSSPFRDDFRSRGRPRERGRRRPLSEDTESDMSFVDASPPGRPRGGRRFGGGGGLGMGMGMGGRMRRPGSGPGPGEYYEPADPRIRSAPDLGMGYPGMAGPRGPPRGISPQMARGMSPGGPGYGGGMGVPGGNPYAYPQARVGTPFQGPMQPPLTMQPQPRRPTRPPELNEIPMGIYGANVPPAPPRRANTEPQTATRLNRTQGPNKKTGPSGQEWLEGDPFLDACTCTTNCNCRKGQRVLYRSQAQDGDGHNGYGEIRYVLKDDLGKDCGDHSACRKDDGGGRKSDRRKGRREPKDAQSSCGEPYPGLQEDLNAIHEKLDGITLNRQGGGLGRSSRSPYGEMPPGGAHGAMMEGLDSRMGPRMGGDLYGMSGPGRLPGGMGGMGGPMGEPMGARQGRFPRGGMPGPMPGDLGFEDELPFSETGFGMGDMMSPMEMGGRPGRMMGGRHSMPSDFMGPRRRGRGGRRGPPGTGIDMDMGGFGRGPPMGGRGMGGRRPKMGRRTHRPEFGDDDMDMDMGMRGGMGGRGGPDEYGDMDDDDDEAWLDENDADDGPGMRQSPSGRRGRPRMGRHMNGRGGGGGRQARVDEDEDGI